MYIQEVLPFFFKLHIGKVLDKFPENVSRTKTSRKRVANLSDLYLFNGPKTDCKTEFPTRSTIATKEPRIFRS